MIGNDSQLSTNINISRTMGRKGGGGVCIEFIHTLYFVLSRITTELVRNRTVDQFSIPYVLFSVELLTN